MAPRQQSTTLMSGFLAVVGLGLLVAVIVFGHLDDAQDSTGQTPMGQNIEGSDQFDPLLAGSANRMVPLDGDTNLSVQVPNPASGAGLAGGATSTGGQAGVTPGGGGPPVPPTLSPKARATTTLGVNTTSVDTLAPNPTQPTISTTTIIPPASPSSAPTDRPTTTSSPTSVSTTGVAPTTAPPAGGHSPTELEIFRLTNQLRANPAGELAREGPMPSCVTQGPYGIELDPATGHPKPAPPLTLDETVSLQMARPWSVRMNSASEMSHRPNQIDFLASIGIQARVSGENVAWSSGYSDSQAAMVHFRGWRESNTGHYCAMLAPVYTHIGVGHHKGAQKSWATQNFYSPR